MKKISFFFLLLFISLLSFSQKKGSISVKKEGEIYFFRKGDFKDTTIIKNISDIFYLDLSNDKKELIEIKLSNATFLTTKNKKEFKLVYAPGMKYRMVYVSDNAEKLGTIGRTFEVKISPDGASTEKKEIEIELWDTKENKLILKNVYYYLNN